MEKDLNGVVFRVKGLVCALNALDVREILAGTDWRPLSVEGEVGDYLKIRGKTARVWDLGPTFGFPPAVPEGVNCFVTVEAPALRQGSGQGSDRNHLVAFWVDSVLELVNVPAGNLKSIPPSFAEIPASYLQAAFDYQGEPAYLLNLLEILKAGFPGGKEWTLEDKQLKPVYSRQSTVGSKALNPNF